MICEQEHSGAAAEEDGAAALKKRGLEVVDEDPRQHINLVFIGHVDAGKSTLCGSTLYRTGQAHTNVLVDSIFIMNRSPSIDP